MNKKICLNDVLNLQYTRHMYLLFDSFCEFPRPLTEFHDTNPRVYLTSVSDGFVRINSYRLMNWGKNKVRKKCVQRLKKLNSFYLQGHLSNQNSINIRIIHYFNMECWWFWDILMDAMISNCYLRYSFALFDYDMFNVPFPNLS